MLPHPQSLPQVTKDPFVRLPSTWRDAIGKRLTDARILKYQREGRYGEAAKLLYAKPTPKKRSQESLFKSKLKLKARQEYV